jgi:predicted DNA-binding protein
MNKMKEIKLTKSTDKIIGALRCSTKVFDKVEKLAKENKVTKQDIIRAILEECIDEVKIKV